MRGKLFLCNGNLMMLLINLLIRSRDWSRGERRVYVVARSNLKWKLYLGTKQPLPRMYPNEQWTQTEEEIMEELVI